MAWANSKAFAAWLTDSLNRTEPFDLDADTLRVALFDNTITPSATVASAASAYNAGVWASGGVVDAVSWPAVGRPLAGVTSGFSGSLYTLDASDTVSVDNTTDLANVFGCEVYDDTVAAPVADQGICFIYFGGANSVVNGTFTVVWNASGLLSGSV